MSGSYSGGISFFKGDGKGGFTSEAKLTQTNGKPISDEYAQSPCFGDWDGDGDWDTVVGLISGPVNLHKNQGVLKFDAGTPLTSEGKVINQYDGGPCIVDWDGDGILDLLMGNAIGNVLMYKGLKQGSTELGKPVDLIPAAPSVEAMWKPVTEDPNSPTGYTARRPGVRTKPFAADWNSDGKLDLLVGDFLQIEGKAPKLTAAQIKERDRLTKEMNELSEKVMPSYNGFSKAGDKELGKPNDGKLTKEEQKKWMDAYMKAMNADKTFNERQKLLQAKATKLRKLKPESDATGFVWVYLRK
jgi:hypothetical protein